MLSRLPSLTLLLGVLALAPTGRAAEPFVRANDIVALVGGEDLVSASDDGTFELQLQRALPQYRLKLRCLAVEGDTVFEQPRDLNFPSIEQQLDEVGATVVVAQFGQMESLAGVEKLPAFLAAYEKLIEHLRAGGKRRVILMLPEPFGATDEAGKPKVALRLKMADEPLKAYVKGIVELAQKLNLPAPLPAWTVPDTKSLQRDGVHLGAAGLKAAAWSLTSGLANTQASALPASPVDDALRTAIQAKNRYWYRYSRPQNWAFLNGDRTEQPSSRDHLDPSKRWFPEEMKQWLPLIDTKEQEIWALAAKAAQP